MSTRPHVSLWSEHIVSRVTDEKVGTWPIVNKASVVELKRPCLFLSDFKVLGVFTSCRSFISPVSAISYRNVSSRTDGLLSNPRFHHSQVVQVKLNTLAMREIWPC